MFRRGTTAAVPRIDGHFVVGSGPIVTLPVVAIALLFWAAVFMICFTSLGTTPLDFFLGRYEVPPELGAWKAGTEDTADGLLREERWLLPEGRASSGYLLLQVRYRDPVTRAIVRIAPEQRVPRRRVGRNGHSES